MTQGLRRILISAYVVLGLLTLGFQIKVRTESCAGAVSCATSYAKGVAWSAVWPLSWLVLYLVSD